MEIIRANFENYDDYHITYITALRQGFIHFCPNNFINNFDKSFYEYFTECSQNKSIEMYICYQDSQPIGVFSIDKYIIEQTAKPQALLDSIYFLKNMHGKGYARTALDYIEGRARELGYTHIYLWCSKENERAWHFYQKNGYQPTDKKWDDILDGKTFHNILFQKEL